jgi:uncharacterized protein YbjT (DUF2867 family)
MSVVVTGASAGQGRAIATRLAASGYRVKAMSRSPETLALRMPADITCVSGDFSDPEGLVAAMRGAETLVLTLPLVFDRAAFLANGQAALQAAERAGVARIVYNASVCAGDRPLGDVILDVIRTLVQVVLDRPIPAAVVRPPLFLENLLAPWTLPDVLHAGVLRYPLPADRRVPWLSQANLARYVQAVLDWGETGTVRDIADPTPLTGGDLADLLSDCLARQVVYEPIDPRRFAERAGAMIGAEGGRHLADLYRLLGDPALGVFDRPYRRNLAELGPALIEPSDWMADHIRTADAAKRPTLHDRSDTRSA